MRLTRRQVAVGAAAAAVTGTSASAADRAWWPVGTELWSWTTPEQIAELDAGGPLFSRTERPGKGKGYAFERLRLLPDLLAKVLLVPRFAKGRYAWVNPWATCIGFGDEQYGTELLRIELRPGAMLAAFDDRRDEVDVVSLDGRRASPLWERRMLAGFLFTNDRATLGSFSCSTFGGDGAYREVYLGDTSLVARWSYRTAEIASRLERDIARLAGLARAADGRQQPSACAWLRQTRDQWVAGSARGYEAELAFAHFAYQPTAPALKRIVETLQARLFRPR